MKIRISFYLNDKSETNLTTIYNTDIIPFKVGDKFWFSIEGLHPRTIDNLKKKWKEDFVNGLIKNNSEQQKLRGRYKIISIYRALEHDPNKENDEDTNRLITEYKVKKVKIIYWRFWRKYTFKKWFETNLGIKI